MDSNKLMLGTIALGLGALFLIALRLNLYSLSGVRHIHRYYFALLMQAGFYLFFLCLKSDILFAHAYIAVPLGCAVGCALFFLTKHWFNRHFDGNSLSVDVQNSKRILQLLFFCLLAPFIFNGSNTLFYPAMGTLMIAWSVSTLSFIEFLRKLEKKVGHPIFERKGLPPRAAN